LLALLGYADPPLSRDTRLEHAGLDQPDGEADAAPAAVADLISALAAEAPVVVVVDDLHDASPQTVDALGATLNRLAGPVLVVLLGRPEMVRTAGALTRLADAEVHPLPPLRGAEAARLLTAYLGGGRLAAPDTDRLLATAQGNPFYLAELVTLLLERGSLSKEDGTWRLAPRSLSGGLLSRDLAAVLAARIDALPAEARALLRDAAVVGDTLPSAALEAVRERRSTSDTRSAAAASVDADRAIDELLARRMLLRTRGGFTFATPLMREAAYAGVGKADLAERHARLVRWASSLTLPVPGLGWSNDAVDAFIADQAERAAALANEVSLRPDAEARSAAPAGVLALSRLARRAIRAGEPGQSAQLAERAAALAGGAMPIADRLIHGSAMLQLAKPAQALADAEVVIGQSTVDAASRARALLLAGRSHRLLGEAERGDTVWKEALEIATSARLPTEQAEILRRMGMEDYQRGRLREAQTAFQSALAIAQEAGDRRGEAWALQNLAWVSTTLGDFAAADATLGRAARLFAELGDTSGRAWLRGTTAFSRLLAGRLHEARRLAGAFLPFGERVGERWAVGTLRAVEAFASAELGDLASADREARRAYREFDGINDDWGRGLALVVRGVIARGLGELPHATDLLSEACKYGERTGHPLLVGIAGTTRGFALLAAGDPAAAEADARAVLAVVKGLDVVESARFGPRVLLGAARLAQGDTDAALISLGDLVIRAEEPAVLLPRRVAFVGYAQALLAAGRPTEAVDIARRGTELPADDVRSRVVTSLTLARALNASGERGQARAIATGAVRAAYATQQVSERAAADALLAELS
jgi:tetratricopeptide (TPR) repeat protein